MLMEEMKVFDCQEMPDDVRAAFFKLNEGKINDVFVPHQIGYPDDYPDPDPTPDVAEAMKDAEAVDKWLMEHGAEDEENVLVKHWW